jgi:tetratricopeptide (TPR) repeat protein
MLMRSSHTGLRMMLAVVMLISVGFLGGCKTTRPQADKVVVNPLDEIRTAYDAQQYARAYRLGASAARGTGFTAEQAAYMAGLSAQKLGRTPDAIGYLSQAARSSDDALAGDALATLGLIYAQQNLHLKAAEHFLAASKKLVGQGKANALFYAAISEQKLGRWADARAHLSLARAASDDNNFKAQVDDQFSVTGYSLQLGAYSDRDNASRALLRWNQQVQGKRMGQARLVPQRAADGSSVITVQVGQFSSYSTALMARQELGDIDVIIVPLR